MSNYIDADKLIAEIERLSKENKELQKSGGSVGREFLFGIGAGYADVITIINSIQKLPLPQSHWKPSKEQMKALNAVANEGALLGLFNDLLKLF